MTGFFVGAVVLSSGLMTAMECCLVGWEMLPVPLRRVRMQATRRRSPQILLEKHDTNVEATKMLCLILWLFAFEV